MGEDPSSLRALAGRGSGDSQKGPGNCMMQNLDVSLQKGKTVADGDHELFV